METTGKASVGETWVRSSRKLFISIIKKSIYRIKVSIKHLIWFWKKLHWKYIGVLTETTMYTDVSPVLMHSVKPYSICFLTLVLSTFHDFVAGDALVRSPRKLLFYCEKYFFQDKWFQKYEIWFWNRNVYQNTWDVSTSRMGRCKGYTGKDTRLFLDSSWSSLLYSRVSVDFQLSSNRKSWVHSRSINQHNTRSSPPSYYKYQLFLHEDNYRDTLFNT